MDKDSPLFRSVRKQMISMMRPVITFLNYLKKERENDTPQEDRVLNMAVEAAEIQPLSQIVSVEENLSDVFIYPKPTPKPKRIANEGRIQYYRPNDKIEMVKRTLDVKTNQEVGQKTFDYYFEMEIGD